MGLESIANQEAMQMPGHLYGPRRPTIGFWLGENYLGEVFGHPTNVEAARAKLAEQNRMLAPMRNWWGYLRHANHTVYC